jgi:hypothetical protein
MSERKSNRVPAPRASAPHDAAGTAVALVLAAIGGVAIWQARDYSTLGQVFPMAIAGAMVVLCLLVVARNLLTRHAPPEIAADEPGGAAGGSNLRRVLLLVVMTVWVVLLPVLGFYVASLLGFLGAMAVAIHDRPRPREAVVMGIAATFLPLGFWLLMVEVLRIPVPRGLLF